MEVLENNLDNLGTESMKGVKGIKEIINLIPTPSPNNEDLFKNILDRILKIPIKPKEPFISLASSKTIDIWKDIFNNTHPDIIEESFISNIKFIKSNIINPNIIVKFKTILEIMIEQEIKNDIQNRLNKLILKSYNKYSEELHKESENHIFDINKDIETDLGFDSLDKVELLMEIEKEFKITINDEEVYKLFLVDSKISSIIDFIYSKVN